MKKFLCYDTNDASSGKVNVSANGVLKPTLQSLLVAVPLISNS